VKAMILAAGYGTRLKPLTDNIPKALVIHKGKTLLGLQIERLKNSGISEIVINAHHHSERIVEFIMRNELGIKVNIIVEKEILGTGGGVLNAADYLNLDDFFIVMNVDIDTDFNFKKIIEFHKINKPLATIGIQKRKTKRYLEFTPDLFLRGRENKDSSKNNLYAFNGIHVISKDFFSKRFEIKYCDIIDLYLELVKRGEKIKGFDLKYSSFKDLGKKENLN
jgi:NDP-sugar pyrophosphorylase family protein